ncbi:TPA: hypothetical protein N0F65_001362 [Lagenidium giganteum]|uniref:Uncharacterized protein n=1 Tax=Lagenidium giganteum TaxID=4803 RepID=A0AAV2YZY6_9STRA|nr:TPA: hypothetical protein N0F65_001362 [Lagenidium giganteum]
MDERAVLCECCSLALDAEREVDGVLLCKRCGFLTVLDVKLRTQVQIAPFSRAVLILRVMYEKSIDKSELVEIMASIEQFLLQRSTIVKVKYDLLEALKIQLQLDDVSALPAGHAPRHDRGDYSTAIRVVRNCATEQFRHRYASFQALSKRYMALIGYANKHLFALYSAAQNLSKMQLTTLEAHADQTVDHVRKRRRFGAAVPTATQPRLPGTGRAVARVQQSIEYGNRLSEISKKVDLWRSLSYTIATSCVFDVIEIWNGDGES